MRLKKWKTRPVKEDEISGISSGLGCGRLLSRTLVSYGYRTPDTAGAFIEKKNTASGPLTIPDMEKAVGRIERAIDEGTLIEIFGDYDVDGITSTAMLYTYLESAGADVRCSLPVRDSAGGYGLSDSIVERMSRDGVGLVITVDNGISSFDAVKRASELGIDCIICDHHKVGPELPGAYAVVDPLRQEDSDHACLAGVGVALELVAAMEGCRIDDIMDEFGPLAALGTVSDVMELTGENRFIVSRGLEAMRNTDIIGLRCLAEAAGTDIEKADEKTIAFVFAPRINAAGRMADASTALELFLTEDEERASFLAQELCRLNSMRQEAEHRMEEEIEAEISTDRDARLRPALVLSGEEFNTGVSGIACSRLAEKYGKPTIIISENGEEARGSGRSVPGVSLYNALSRCSDILDRFGGHELAAGFTLRTKNVGEFKKRIEAVFSEMTGRPSVEEIEVIDIDDMSELDTDSVAELSRMAPFGNGNPEPVFGIRGAAFLSASKLGDRHTRLSFTKDGRQFSAAYFGALPDSFPFKPGDQFDVAVNAGIYEAPTGSIVSYRVADMQPCGTGDDDFKSISDYLGYRSGGISAGETGLELSRDTEARLYKTIRKAGKVPADSVWMMDEAGEMTPGEAMAGLDVLEELGLCTITADGFVSIAPASDKKDLNSSRIFRDLNAGGGA
ncbi:MAG: single-stranded-DNA-specific exonuclease RecJ [Oscillospiraceae bacterium]|jgi:single-stranded-DNA-specific exonuclease